MNPGPCMPGKLTTTGAQFIPSPWKLCSKCEHSTLPTKAQVSKACTGHPVLILFILGCSGATSGSADSFPAALSPTLQSLHGSQTPRSSTAGAGGCCHLCFSLCSRSKTGSFCSETAVSLVLVLESELPGLFHFCYSEKPKQRWQRKAMQGRAVMTQEAVIAFLSWSGTLLRELN